MPPRRKKSKSRRRRFKGVNLWNVAESLVQANIVTQNIFGTDPLAFLVGKTSAGYGHSSLAVSNVGRTQIGIGELLGLGSANGEANREAAWNNVKSNWMPLITQTVATRVGFTVAKRLTRGIRSDMNKGFRMVGLQNEVKV
jgi:hypothetical protein